MKKYKLTTILLIAIFSISTSISAQASKQLKYESILTSKKWTCLEVNRGKLEKIDFRIEVGNELSLRIDKKYSFKNNDYLYQAGTWKLDGKMLYFFYQDSEKEGRINTAQYKILKLTETQLKVKKLDRPKGKLLFK